ncbi:uncharacterized protein LOC130810247 [Amaranthus tricolor]|uniref:uncharacterized protein LOC130810247 n=1 Tax=Amaranthus tricolor TaxID=29722 RepID=UPI002589D034|nr:uncharacterized protein LOC130810247 [Amaranthus tricolor]
MLLTASTILHKPIIFFPQNHKCKFTKPPITFSVSSSIQKIDEHISSVPENPIGRTKTKERVFFLDVNPICYKGNTPSLHSFAHWISLFLSEVSLHHPVIAVFDGEGGHEYRKQILPSYKAHRIKFLRRIYTPKGLEQLPIRRSQQTIVDFLKDCNVPILKIEGQEADDVIATLTNQVLDKGMKVVIASPDKDFKQLISEDVQLVQPVPELKRWSFYTLKQYFAQYNCDPQSDLSLRCIIGDEVDGVPGIQNLVPGFGRKTALKLIKKHGSLEHLLNAASVRIVGKQYVQEALEKYSFELRRNYQVLSLRRDVDVHVKDEWLSKRDTTNDSVTIAKLFSLLKGS